MKELEVLNRGYQAFEIAMRLAFCDGFGDDRKEKDLICDAYYITDKNELVLTLKSEKGTKLPYMMNKKQTIDFAWGFVQSNEPFEKMGGGGDGSYEKGFRVSDNVGFDYWGSFVKVCAAWVYYGK